MDFLSAVLKICPTKNCAAFFGPPDTYIELSVPLEFNILEDFLCSSAAFYVFFYKCIASSVLSRQSNDIFYIMSLLFLFYQSFSQYHAKYFRLRVIISKYHISFLANLHYFIVKMKYSRWWVIDRGKSSHIIMLLYYDKRFFRQKQKLANFLQFIFGCYYLKDWCENTD